MTTSEQVVGGLAAAVFAGLAVWAVYKWREAQAPAPAPAAPSDGGDQVPQFVPGF